MNRGLQDAMRRRWVVSRYTSEPDDLELVSTQSPEVNKSMSELLYVILLRKAQGLPEHRMLLKAAAVMDLPNLVITKCDDDAATFAVECTDVKNPTPNTFRINVTADTVPESEFKAVLKIENLKFLPDSYKVCISTKGVSKWTGTKAEYFVAIEASSSKF